MARYFVEQHREAQNLSPSELARRAGMTARLLRRLIRGETDWKTKYLEALARALNVPVTALWTPDDALPHAVSVSPSAPTRPPETHLFRCLCGAVMQCVVYPQGLMPPETFSLREACGGWLGANGGPAPTHQEAP